MLRLYNLSLDLLRATLGCILLIIQGRAVIASLPAAGGWRVLLSTDWGFAVAVACHVAWLVSCTAGSRAVISKSLRCSSRLTPKVSLLVQLMTQRAVPATVGWYNEALIKKVFWRALADVLVYTCGKDSLPMVLLATAFDTACRAAIWTRVYALSGTHPPKTAAATYVLTWLSLSLFFYFLHQRRANSGFKWGRAQRRLEQTVAKDYPVYDIPSSHKPVYSSMLCCSNPDLLSHIAAVSHKDLQPVRLDRLGNCGVGYGNPPLPLASSKMVEAAAGPGGTEAYELARRLVSSAGSSGSGAADGSGYTSAARKVRVSVKIPGRSPEELRTGWDTDLQINGQRRAVVFTYIRRGCIQLVLDFLMPGPLPPSLEARAASATQLMAAHGDSLMHQSEGSSSLDAATGDVVKNAGQMLALPHTTRSGPELQSGGKPQCVEPDQASSGASKELREQPEASDLPVTQPAAGRLQEHMLRALCSEPLVANQAVTLQVGAKANLVRTQAQPAGGATLPGAHSSEAHGTGAEVVMGPPLALPPNVCIWPQVVCTGGGWQVSRMCPWWLPSRRREAFVTCSWGAGEDRTGPASSADVHPLPTDHGLQLTARQQGQFLPVALTTMQSGNGRGIERQLLRAALAEGSVVATVSRPERAPATAVGDKTSLATAHQDKPRTVRSRTQYGTSPCLLAFTPASRDGLVQVELSQRGIHSAAAACVLLLSSSAAACELEQLQAAAGGGLNLGAARQPSMVTDVIRDFGIFMDFVPAIAGCCSSSGSGAARVHEEGSCSSLPLIEWSLSPMAGTELSVPVPVRAIFTHCRSCCAAAKASARVGNPRHACFGGREGACPVPTGEGGNTSEAKLNNARRRKPAAAACDTRDEDADHRVLLLASLACRMGLSLLRYFLSAGMVVCATHVLDILHRDLGVPPRILAGSESCSERMTLLHHAARSGSFRTTATVAGWLEDHGIEPEWGRVERSSGGGSEITPLHLLAVIPGCEMAAALVQMRWPAARRAWYGSKAGGGTPAQFEALARETEAVERPIGIALSPPLHLCTRWFLRATANAPVSLAVGGTWRCLVAARRSFLPLRVVRASTDLLVPAMAFSQPTLESLYVTWLQRRMAFMDHLFFAMYATFVLTQAKKGGFSFSAEKSAGLVMLVIRALILVLHVTFRRALQRRPSTPPSVQSGSTTLAGWGRAIALLLAFRESIGILLEFLRLFVMLLLASGGLSMPETWHRFMQLRLDFLFNAVIRPTAGQMRMFNSCIVGGLSLVGETAVTATVYCGRPGLAAAWCLAPAFARGALSHGLGLGVNVLLQTAARARFLGEMRGDVDGIVHGNKARAELPLQ